MKFISQTVIMATMLSSFTLSSCGAAIKNAKTETAKVYGNCDMCKDRIETAANKKGLVQATWNVDTKMLSFTYDSVKTSSDEVLKRIAYAGHDNDKFVTPDDVYTGLPGCCHYDRKMASHDPAVQTTAAVKQDSTKKDTAVAVSNVNPLETVFASYFSLKDALAKDDGSAAATQAKALFKAIDNAPMDKMAPQQHAVWMKLQQKLSYDAEHIKSVTDIEHQREHFISLSKNMHDVIKVFKPAFTVYYDFCPMANDGKGAYWLSLQEKISNPYMGKQMPTCGKVTETITK